MTSSSLGSGSEGASTWRCGVSMRGFVFFGIFFLRVVARIFLKFRGGFLDVY